MASHFAHQCVDLENIENDDIRNNVKVQYDIERLSTNVSKHANP